MKIYVKASEELTDLDIFRYESKLCKFMRDNYGMSCSINNNNYVCNLGSDERLACVVASPEYHEISMKDNYARNGIASGLIMLYVPYNAPLNDATAQKIIECLSFTDDERSVRDAEKSRIKSLEEHNNVMNQGNYVVALIRDRLGVKPESKHTGRAGKFDSTKITRIDYKVDATIAEKICNICKQVSHTISTQVEYPDLHTMDWDTDDTGVVVWIERPLKKMIVDPKTLEIIEIEY